MLASELLCISRAPFAHEFQHIIITLMKSSECVWRCGARMLPCACDCAGGNEYVMVCVRWCVCEGACGGGVCDGASVAGCCEGCMRRRVSDCVYVMVCDQAFCVQVANRLLMCRARRMALCVPGIRHTQHTVAS